MSSPSRVVFSCPLCNAPLRALAVQKGEVFSCPGCSENVEVPATARASAEEDDWWAVDLPETGGVPAALATPKPKPAASPSKSPSQAPSKDRSAPSTGKAPAPAANPTAANPPATRPAPKTVPGSQATPPKTGNGGERAPAKPNPGNPIPAKPRAPAASNSRPANPAANTASSATRPPGAAKPSEGTKPTSRPAASQPPATPVAATPVGSNPSFEDPDDLFGKLQPLEPNPAKRDDADPNAWLMQHGYGPLDDLPAFPDAPPSASPNSGSPAKEGGSKPGSAAPNNPLSAPAVQHYRARCRVCEALVTVRPSQAGKEIRCPDCHSHFVVPPPPAAPKATGPTATGVSPVIQASVTSTDTETIDRTDAYGRTARDYLKAAEEAPPDNPDEDFENPDVQGWAKHIFSMFIDPGVLLHLFGLVMLAAVLSLVASIGGPYVQLVSIIKVLATGLLTVISLGCGVVILEGTSHGSKRIENWPAADPMEWLGHLFVICAATFVSIIPGFVLGYFTGHPAAQLTFVLMSFHCIFPVAIMSMLDNNSPFQPISSEVMRSIPRIPESWIGFYITGGVVLTVYLVTFVVSGWLPTTVAYFLCYSGLTLTIFLYMRMLGHLGYEVGVAVNNAEEDVEKDHITEK